MKRFGLFIALFLLIAPSASGQASITEGRQRLAKIRQERTKLRTQLKQLQNREQSVSGQLRNIERQVSTSAALINELDRQLRSTETDIERTTRELIETRQQLAMRRDLLHTRLGEIYKRGPLHTPEVLLSAQSFSDLLNRYKYLSLITERDRALVHTVTELKGELEVRERRLRRALSQVQTLRGERVEEYGQLRGLESQRKEALASVQQQTRATNQRLTKLEQDEKRLTSLIATLEKRRREAEARRAAEAKRAAARPGAAAPKAPAALLTTRDIGNLGWPVEGRVVYRFGRSVQPNGTTIRRNGIGIGAATGTPVRAVEGGTVVLAEPFEGYGPSVILSHGGGYYSLYLYLNGISVAEGGTVARGQTLGTVGGQNTPEGAHIEFQIRTPGGAATDPLSWLRKQAR